MLASLLFHICGECSEPSFAFVDRKPGDIQALTDFLLEDYKNFPKVPELGEETARFIRQEMEDTWGEEHLRVLPEDEAQHWILGVCLFISFLDLSGNLS